MALPQDPADEGGNPVVARDHQVMLADRLTREGSCRAIVAAGASSAQNLWRMRQFFEAYRGDPKLPPR